ncbi:MAG TPA: sialidase family protein [Ktedonobacteraceae bacterium]|nr:sialidase family protein [Ktedonobacteraceae bacterium]
MLTLTIQHARRLFSTPIVLIVMFVLLSTGAGGAVFAKSTSARANDDVQFTQQKRIGFQSGDDWEPAIAADRYGHIYTLFKHYDVSGGGTCSACDRHLLFQRSDDGGNSWSAPRAIDPVVPVHGGQYDPQIMVDPVDGRTVWASFLQNTNSVIAVVKSTDFGRTWSAPMLVSTRPPGLDKDELAVRGNEIVVVYDDNLNTWATVSLNGGKTWTTHEVFPTSNRFSISLSAGAAIDSHGNIFISWDSFDKAHSNLGNGPATVWVSKSTDSGKTWTRTVINVSGAPPNCNNCGYAFLSSQMALRIGSDDTIYLLWNSTVDLTNFASERIFFARSTNDGNSYSEREDISSAPPGVEHCFPAIAVGQQAGDVRIGWMDKRTGRWNLFFRESHDGGENFSSTVQVSSFVPGYPYLYPNGYDLPYGDYFSMVVDQNNRTQMVFGEAPSYQGPGNQWVSHSLDD